eukprot:s2867_g13.t1
MMMIVYGLEHAACGLHMNSCSNFSSVVHRSWPFGFHVRKLNRSQTTSIWTHRSMRIFLLSLVCVAAYETEWPEEAEECNLLLLQVQQRLTKTEVPNKSAAALQELETMSLLQGDQELHSNESGAANSSLPELSIPGPEHHWAPLRHWSAALLLSRSASRLLTQGHSPDIIGEIVLTCLALFVWIFFMMLCSWLGFGGTNRLEEQREMERQEKHLPPEIHDPIDAAANQLREAQKKQALARKENAICC